MTVSELIKRAKSCCGCVYCYGAKMEPVTKENIEKWAKNSPNVYTSNYKQKCMDKIGRLATDCSGLVCYSANLSHIGSSQMKSRWVQVPLEKAKAGMCLWRNGHVAIATSDYNQGKIEIIEAKGVDYDVLYHSVNVNNFTCALLIPGINYEENENKTNNGIPGWKQENGKWKYYKGEKDCYKSCVVRIKWNNNQNQDYFAFDKDGNMKTGYFICKTDEDGCIEEVI